MLSYSIKSYYSFNNNNPCFDSKKTELLTLPEIPLFVSSSTGPLLAEFLEKDELFYQLTTLKKDQKDFTTAEINASVKSINFSHRSIKNPLKSSKNWIFRAKYNPLC
ncbi:hypothetical protein PGH45_19360 [Legionella pneumophila]|nr:hypothetical protein [Legionella pneumophila]